MPVVQLWSRVVTGVGEALVVSEIQIGLGAVIGDVDFAMLVRAHRAGIDVDVRVELLERHPVAVSFEQTADRRRRESLAQRRDDAAGHEDVFHGPLMWCSRIVDPSPPRDARRDEPADALQILRRVDADRVVSGFDRLDAESVLERAQLFEPFGPLERRRLELRAIAAGTRADST